MGVVTRFAPSPTGFLHIGGARTALFNWLFTRQQGGKYLLRIEDTDRKRSTPEAIDAILAGMDWLGLGDYDEPPTYQSTRADRHVEIAEALLASGNAYRCYASPEELSAMREAAKDAGRPMRYDGTWRDRDPGDAPAGIDPVIRFRAPQEGETVLEDLVQGSVRVANDQLDDMVLLRADGSPTYMLSVVVDDHDMGITHAIRGDDHLTNAFRQTQLFRALDWNTPEYAHIPLLHGADGAKLSKRHGALGVEAYRAMGFLPEAMLNYLVRLGWAHGDDEIISMDQAREWFRLADMGRSPARFDMDKLTHLNAHYMQQADDKRLADITAPGLAETLGTALTDTQHEQLVTAMGGLKSRARTTLELVENSAFYFAKRPLSLNPKAEKILAPDGRAHLQALAPQLTALVPWTAASIEQAIHDHAETHDLKLGALAQPLRAALSGSNVSPGIFEVMEILGKDECLGRIKDVTDES